MHATVLILIALLLTAGGWFPSRPFGVQKEWHAPLALGLLLIASRIPVTAERGISLCPADALLALLALIGWRTRHPIRLGIYALAAGLSGWQIGEWFPLLPLLAAWELVPTLLLCLAGGLDAGGKRLLLVAAPLLVGACTAISDRFLFGYATVPIGSEAGTAASVLGLLILEAAMRVRKNLAGKMPERWGFLPPLRKENPEI